jgi:hypothetical protein
MIEHIVLFRSKPNTSPEIKKQIVAYARSMQSHIPEILYISSGENWSDRGDGFELALVSRFKDKATLDVYQKHPYHQTFVNEWVKPNIEKILAIDYFIE